MSQSISPNIAINAVLPNGGSFTLGEQGIIFSDDFIFETTTIDENINADGGVTLGWNTLEHVCIPAGTTLTFNGKDYVLMKTYVPSSNGDGSYRYDVKFSDWMALLGKQLFYKTVQLMENPNVDEQATPETEPLYTFNFVGFPGRIINAIAKASGCVCIIHDGETSGTFNGQGDVVGGSTIISVSFDGDTIKSAAEKVGDAIGVEVWYTSGKIHFGSPVGPMTDEYYNHFIVLGGTRNMGKKISTSQGEEYAAVTQRLALPSGYNGGRDGVTVSEGSIITFSEHSAAPRMDKLLIFDDIYPKVQMRINNVMERHCWMLDEEGNKIRTDAQDPCSYLDSSDGNYYKSYSKWYIQLESVGANIINQDVLNGRIIDGTVLRMQFLPFKDGKYGAENFNGGALAGREFELVHFKQAAGDLFVSEKESDDVGDFKMYYGSNQHIYRIVFNADGNTIIPSTSQQGLVPQNGDIVSFINVAVPETCYENARQELYVRGVQAALQFQNNEPSSETREAYPRLVDGRANPDYTLELGETVGSYIVTSIQHDLITGLKTITLGTLTQKGVLSSVVDKVEGAQASGGGGTENTPQPGSDMVSIGTISDSQWKTLAQAGGYRNIKTVNTALADVQDELASLGVDVDNVQSQADARMDLWFGMTVPHPIDLAEANNESTWNYPATLWNTAMKREEHEEDIYYNYNREAADVNGGKAYKWTKHTVGSATKHWWSEITDADTLAALEKASDVASDGKLSGGAEKVRVYGEWKQAVENHKKHAVLFQELGGYADDNVSSYDEWFENLAWMLNGGVILQDTTARNNLLNGITIPSLLSELNVTTDIFFGSSYISDMNDDYDIGLDMDDDNAELSKELYRFVWNTYYEKLTAIEAVFKRRANDAYQKVEDLADDGIISGGTEKQQLRITWENIRQEFKRITSLAQDYGFGVSTNPYYTTYSDYLTASQNLVTMLNGGTFDQNLLNGGFPLWINDANFNKDTTIASTTYRSNWNNYYTTYSALQKAVEDAARTTAQQALSAANSAIEAVQQIAGDGELSVDEIVPLKVEFEKAYRERAEMVDLATFDDTHKLIDASLFDDINTYLSNFKKLVTYLNKGSWAEPPTYNVVNNGTAENATYNVHATVPIPNASLPLLFSEGVAQKFQADWQNPTANGDGGATVTNLWAAVVASQTALANAVATLTKTTADEAKASAEEALGEITNLASDGVISAGREKLQLLIQWRSAVAERNIAVAQANAYIGNNQSSTVETLQGIITQRNNFNAAYDNLVGMMNNFVFNSLSTEAERNELRDGTTLPDWVGAHYDDDIDLTTPLANVPNTTWKDAFINRWTNFYTNINVLFSRISSHEKYLTLQNTNALADIASDGKITESEKNDILQQWRAWAAEYDVFCDAKDDSTIIADTEWDAYYRAFHNLGRFLDDPTVTLPNDDEDVVEIDITGLSGFADFIPDMLAASGTYPATGEMSAATIDKYNAVLLAFRKARTTLLTALSTGKMGYWVSEDLPENGFFVGDRCRWMNHRPDGTEESGTDTTMVCIKEYDSNYHDIWSDARSHGYDSETGWQEYWTAATSLFSDKAKDPRSALVALANLLYMNYPNTNQITSRWPFHVVYRNGAYVLLDNSDYPLTSSDAAYDDIMSLLSRLNVLLEGEWFSVYIGMPSSSVTLSQYDLACIPIEVSIPGSSDTIIGGIQIKMFFNNAWEYLQETTSGLLENFGTKVLAMVFGSKENAVEMAGLNVGQRFAYLFANAEVDGQSLAEAMLGVRIVYDETTKTYYSEGKIDADKIELSASQILSLLVGDNNTADSLNGIGIVIAKEEGDGHIKIGVFGDSFKGIELDENGNIIIDASQLQIDASSLDIKAEDVDFQTGNFQIGYNKDGSRVITFAVDSEGKVSLNEAVVSGNIYAKSLFLEKEAEVPNLIAQNTLSRDPESSLYSRIQGGKFEVGTYEATYNGTPIGDLPPSSATLDEDNLHFAYKPRYEIRWVRDSEDNNYPAICFLDKDGNVVGVIDENLFKKLDDIPDSWKEKTMYFKGNDTPSEWIETLGTPSTCYQFSNGYTINGDGTHTPHNYAAFDGAWLSSNYYPPTTGVLLNGWYISTQIMYMFNKQGSKYKRYRQCYKFELGRIAETTDITEQDWHVVDWSDIQE